MIIGLQILAILFSFFMIYISVLHYKRIEINGVEFLSWLSIWVVTIFVILFPEMLRIFASKFLITRLFDLMVVGGFILVISLAVKAYLICRKMEKRIEELVRKETLNAKTK